jgi:lysozyme family protein
MTWEQFFEWLMKWEGETVTNDPRDQGGQTAYGISRRYHPQWPGWALIDQGVTSGRELEDLVSAFYRETYAALWDGAPVRVRPVLVDTAVNMGSTYAVQLLQDGMNKLAGSEYLTVDGKWGPKTDYALKHAHHDGLAYAMCALRMAEYNRRARKDKAKQVFLPGWLNRVADLMVAI